MLVSGPAKRKLAALAINLLVVALLWVGTTHTPYARLAERLFLALYFGWIAVLSVNRVRDWISGDLWGFHGLRRKYWRWLTDDYPDSYHRL